MRDILWEDLCIEAPEDEPVSIEEARLQRRITTTSMDALLDRWRVAARQQFEEETGIQCLTATRQFSMERFPIQRAITVGRAPVQAIASVRYVDADNTWQELDAALYERFPAIDETSPATPGIGPYAERGGVQLVEGAAWPTSADRVGAVRITYQAGFGTTPAAVPELLRYAILQYLGDFHRWSESHVEGPITLVPLGTVQVRRYASGRMLSARRLTRW